MIAPLAKLSPVARMATVGIAAASTAALYTTLSDQRSIDRLASAATFGFYGAIAAATGSKPLGVIAPAALAVGYLSGFALSPLADALLGRSAVGDAQRITVDRDDGPVTVEISNDTPKNGTSSAPVEVQIDATDDAGKSTGESDISVDIEVDK